MTPVEAEVEVEFDAFGASGRGPLLRFDLRLGHDAADDVIVADVEVDVGALDRFFDDALGGVEFRSSGCSGGAELFAAGRVFG